MINHHPSLDILQSYVKAELPASITVAVSLHVDMCATCKAIVDAKTAEVADVELATQDNVTDGEFETQMPSGTEPELDLENMLNAITQDDSLARMEPTAQKFFEAGNKTLPIPRALSNINFGDWLNLGKLSRSRMEIPDGNLRSSMLYIGAGGEVPHHTHNGFEITLILDGSFTDEMGSYGVGDFMWLNGEHKHQPETVEGCLCYTVVSDSLHFSHGVSRLLNPIGRLIY
ncbi:ChrR family anti-sigma-E factor [Psychrosphaera sp. B3R10]|uniref:ChrR family anti-sigma-E factor n=1 Tax=unclassified Psychrosphaera TaxID=2641570 RepID=UPI001C09F5B4|nr:MULTISPECIES: ChrR family anti-sigma-E factor [unclassified Psychrosphaera]MBU2882435.1 ChrR family anti-sigma-E factor [Psychrosphaera sp. I2R16]MBU2990256.1 ChrR family anti-sigma-E factor [Psychrosphaera sp. B3R10]